MTISRSATILALAIATALIIGSSFHPPIGLYDEGFTLTNAMRILLGDIPHRDYWAAYPPGTALTLAAAFKLIERSLAVARALNALWEMALVASIYLLVSRIRPPLHAALTALLCALWIALGLYPSYSAIPALTLSVASFALLANGVDRVGHSYAIFGGVALGMTMAFRHDFFAYNLIGLLVTAITLRIADRHDPRSRYSAEIVRFICSAGLTGITILLCLLIWVGSAAELFEQTITFPLREMRLYRSLPVPAISSVLSGEKSAWLLAWAPPLLVLLGGGSFLARREPPQRTRLMVVTLSGALSILYLAQSRSRFDLPHATPSLVWTIIFLAASCESLAFAKGKIRNALTIAILVVLSTSSAAILNPRPIPSLLRCTLNLASDQCPPKRTEQDEIARFIQANTDASDPVFVGNTRHDRIFVNDASLYFLIGRPVAVAWNEMHPGIVTTQAVQESIVRSCEEKEIRYIVLANMPLPTESNASSLSSGVEVLDQYLRLHYEPVLKSTRYTVMRRTGGKVSAGLH